MSFMRFLSCFVKMKRIFTFLKLFTHVIDHIMSLSLTGMSVPMHIQLGALNCRLGSFINLEACFYFPGSKA